MLQPKDISQLSHLTAQGVLMLPVETPSGIVGYVLIQDVLNLVSAPNLSAYMTKTEYASGTTGVNNGFKYCQREVLLREGKHG